MSLCCTCKEKGQQALGLQQKLHKHLKKSWQQRPSSNFHDGNNKEENCQNVWPGLSYNTTPADDQELDSWMA
jgi:hypothetical protein